MKTSLGTGLAVWMGLVSVVHAESRFALVIGNNLGAPDEQPLRWAEQDADRLAQLLGQLGDVPAEHRQLLTNRDAAELRSAAALMRDQVAAATARGERTLLLVFYSGHADPASLHLRDTQISLAEFRDLIRAVPSHATIVVVDACHSGELVSGRNKGASSAPRVDVSYRREVGPRGTVLITSAGAGEVAQESDTLRGSYFTHHLLSGLRGAADRDRDQRVSLEEIYRYVYDRTLATSHGTTAAVQHPELLADLAGEGTVVLSFLNRAQAHLELPPALRGSVLVIEDQSGQVVAEVVKHGADEMRVALAAGDYRIQIRDEARVWTGAVSLRWGGTRRLEAQSLTPQPLYAALEKGSTFVPSRWAAWVWTGGGGSYTTFAQVGWNLGVGLDWRPWPGWWLRLHGRGTRTEGQNERWDFQQYELEAGLSMGREVISVGPVMALGFLGPTMGWVRQSIDRREHDRVEQFAAYDPTRRKQSMGGGLGVDLELRLALAAGFFLGINGSGRGLAFVEAGDVVFRSTWLAGGQIGFGW